MPESGTYGSVPGAPSNGRPYGDPELSTYNALIYSTVQGDARWHFTRADGQTLSRLDWRCRPALVRGIRVGAQRAVVRILADWSLPSQEIHAVYPSPRLVPAKVSRFVGWLQGHFPHEWWVDTK